MSLDRTMLEKHTRERWLPGFQVEIFDEMPLLKLLMQNGVEKASGTALKKLVVVGKNTANGQVSGYGLILTQESDITAMAQLNYSSFYYATVSISLEEEDENSGINEAMVSMVETKMTVAKETLRENVNKHLYLNLATHDGTANGLKTVVGLDAICDTTNTYANINRATAGNEGWQSNRFTTTCTDAELINAAVPAKYFPSILRLRWLATAHTGGANTPTTIVMTKALYELLEYIGETANLRFLGNIANFAFDEVKLGVQGVQGAKAPAVTWDAYCTAKRAFWISPKHFKSSVFPGRNFESPKMKDGGYWREGQQQLAAYMPIVFKGQILCVSPRQQATATALGDAS